jgi:peptide-methionine (S)-S-oxide reductase
MKEASLMSKFQEKLWRLAPISFLLLSFWLSPSAQSASPMVRPGATVQATRALAKDGEHKKMQEAIFGAGCFWGVEETFRETPGVTATEVGYSGGNFKDPTYRDVCTDQTGHAEVVKVTYDPAVVSYEKLLKVFWENHNPTSLNFQGPDHGTQYRSVIFYTTPEQEKEAIASKEALAKSGKFKQPIVTQIEAAQPFYRAEEYHQQYLAKKGLKVCH